VRPGPAWAGLAAALASVLLAAGGCVSGGDPGVGGEPRRTTGTGLDALRAAAALEPCPGGTTGSADLDATGQSPSEAAGALPERALPCLGSGGAVSLRRLTGTPTVLTLWASWCGPCREELPAFQRLHASAGGRVRVLGVLTEDPPEPALSLAADTGVRFPSVIDEKGEVKRALGRSLLPTTVFVRADGSVAHLYTGPPLRDDSLRRLVRERLGVTT